MKHLGKLQELNKEDYKIALNKAIAEFYKSGQTTTCTLKQTLIAMKNQVTIVETFYPVLSMTRQINVKHILVSLIPVLNVLILHQYIHTCTQ